MVQFQSVFWGTDMHKSYTCTTPLFPFKKKEEEIIEKLNLSQFGIYFNQ